MACQFSPISKAEGTINTNSILKANFETFGVKVTCLVTELDRYYAHNYHQCTDQVWGRRQWTPLPQDGYIKPEKSKSTTRLSTVWVCKRKQLLSWWAHFQECTF